jgi:hypothetical protein
MENGFLKVHGESIFCLFFNAQGAKCAKKIRSLCVLRDLGGSKDLPDINFRVYSRHSQIRDIVLEE